MDPIDGPSLRIAALVLLALRIWRLPAEFCWVALLFVAVSLVRAARAWHAATRPEGTR